MVRLSAPSTNQRRRALADDTGSAGYSTFVFVFALMMILGLGVAGIRVFTGAGDLQAAAQSAARAAALEHTMADAQAAAQAVALAEVARSGDACENPTIQVAPGAGGFEPGGTVRVDMQCTVSYEGLYVPFLGPSRTVDASAVEPIDCLRGGGSAALTLNQSCYYGG